jgi:hypothetical protein
VSEQIPVAIQCPNPECKTNKTIQVPSYLFENKKVGLVKIQIHKGVCCDHQFVVFLDKKGGVKGYENIDFQLDLSQFANRTIGTQFFLKDLLNQYQQTAVMNILHALIMKYPISALVGEKDNTKAMNSLLISFLPDEWKKPFVVNGISERDFKKAKIEDDLVVNPEGYLAQVPWQDIPLIYENSLVQKALDILDDESQGIIIQQELEMLNARMKFVIELLGKEKQIYEDDLRDRLSKQFNMTITDHDILYIKRLISRRSKADVSKIKIRSFDKLKEGLW